MCVGSVGVSPNQHQRDWCIVDSQPLLVEWLILISVLFILVKSWNFKAFFLTFYYGNFKDTWKKTITNPMCPSYLGTFVSSMFHPPEDFQGNIGHQITSSGNRKPFLTRCLCTWEESLWLELKILGIVILQLPQVSEVALCLPLQCWANCINGFGLNPRSILWNVNPKEKIIHFSRTKTCPYQVLLFEEWGQRKPC